MRTVKLTIEYDGTDFNGWQIQKGKNCRTVQGEIEAALKTIFKKPTPIRGSGRTDAGVHALGQVAHFKTTRSMDCEEIVRALNGNLPKDIAVLTAAEAPADFHAQYSAKSKTYRYSIYNSPVRSAVCRRDVWHYPHKLNLSAMKREAKAFIGTHDFRSFMAADSSGTSQKGGKNTKRKIFHLHIKKYGKIITFEITANGFLYKMVRNIVGTLVAVGTGQFPPGSVGPILKEKNRDCAGQTAPPQGLCLVEVKY